MKAPKSLAVGLAAALALGGVASVVSAQSAQASSQSFHLYGQIKNTVLQSTPYDLGTGTIDLTVSPASAVVGAPVTIGVTSSDFAIPNGPVANAGLNAEELDAVVAVNGTDYVLRGSQNGQTVTADNGEGNHLFDAGWVISSTPGASSSTSTNATADTTSTTVTATGTVAGTTGVGSTVRGAETTHTAFVAPAAGTYPVTLKALVVNAIANGMTPAIDEAFDEVVNTEDTTTAASFYANTSASYLTYGTPVNVVSVPAPAATATGATNLGSDDRVGGTGTRADTTLNLGSGNTPYVRQNDVLNVTGNTGWAPNKSFTGLQPSTFFQTTATMGLSLCPSTSTAPFDTAQGCAPAVGFWKTPGNGFNYTSTSIAAAVATGGTFTLSVAADGGTAQTTAPIAYNATAATIQADLEALSNVGTGNVTVSGTGAKTYNFSHTLATNTLALTIDGSALTGGTGAVSTTPTGGGVAAASGTISTNGSGQLAPFSIELSSVSQVGNYDIWVVECDTAPCSTAGQVTQSARIPVKLLGSRSVSTAAAVQSGRATAVTGSNFYPGETVSVTGGKANTALPVTITNTASACSAGTDTVTVTTSAAHGLAAGQYVRVAGTTNGGGFNETNAKVAATPTTTTFTYVDPDVTCAAVTSAADTGTVTLVPGTASTVDTPVSLTASSTGTLSGNVTLKDSTDNELYATALQNNAGATNLAPVQNYAESGLLTVKNLAGNFTRSPASIYTTQTAKVTPSGVTADVNTVSINWGDGTSTPSVSKTAATSHTYKTAGTRNITATLRNTATGLTVVKAVGAVKVTKDTIKPVASVTTPKKSTKASSWTTIKGKVSDKGLGAKSVTVQLIEKRSNGKWYYFNGKKWVKTTSKSKALRKAKKLTDTSVTSGAWSVKAKKPSKGKLYVYYSATDKGGNTSAKKSKSHTIKS